MANFTQVVFGNARSGMNVSQALIANAGNNIANVNTPGYSRKRVDVEATPTSRSGLDLGRGAQVGGITNIVDPFVQRALVDSVSEEALQATQYQMLDRVQKMFDISGDFPSIGSGLQEFFTAVNDLRIDPTSLELRTNLLQKAETLADQISSTYNDLAALQTEADTRITAEIEEVNSLTSSIADLSVTIQSKESAGSTAAPERDQREILLQQLGEKISFSSLEQEDGAFMLTLSSGFPLIAGGTARALETTPSPSFGASPPNALGGGILQYVVHDFNPDPGADSHFDLTKTLKDGGGTIGALLRFRGYNDPANTSPFQADGDVVAVAARIESLARGLLTDLNTVYLGADEDSGTAGFQPSALDLDGNTPAVYGLFDVDAGVALDQNGDGLPNDLGNHGVFSYANLLKVTTMDPRKVAAARDVDPAGGSLELAKGNSGNLEALYDMRSTSMSVTVGSYSFNDTLEHVYSDAITYASTKVNAAKVNYDVASGNLTEVRALRDSISEVSLDEEFSNLIMYQKSYEANARMIKIGQTLLDELIALI